MPESTCSIEGCDKGARACGMCGTHYGRWWTQNGPTSRSAEERFFSSFVVAGNGCCHWTKSLIGHGYGQFSVGGIQVYAHRWAYERWVGPIPDGTELDHTCHNDDTSCFGEVVCLHRRCVYVPHLEPVPHRENARRGRTGDHNARKTHCPQGHPYDGDNLVIENTTGRRRCLICKRATGRRWENKNAVLFRPVSYW